MGTVTVYRVELYDAANDAPKISRRWATRQGAETMCGMLLENTAAQIDETELESGNQWTALDFEPKSPGPATFQTLSGPLFVFGGLRSVVAPQTSFIDGR
jgi:hypothetical protein